MMLETAAAGETAGVVGAAGRGEMRRCKALYAIAEVDEEDCARLEVKCVCKRDDFEVFAGAASDLEQDTAVHIRFDAIVV